MAIVRQITRKRDGIIVDEYRPFLVPPTILLPPKRELLPEPTKAEMIGHARDALAKWAASGMKIAPPEIRAARYATCLACEYWDDAARLGLGKCNHPGCGCTRFKMALATEACPAGKWAAYATHRPDPPRADTGLP